MKKILILYPHFPPSNLAGVHRARLFAQHLPAFGWEPIVLTVHEKYYEEALDHELEKLLPANLRVEKVTAFRVGGFRLIGDIGLRAFLQLYQKAKTMILAEKIDFLYIPIPSFYCALLGRWLHASTDIRYGIDYIDPWVHQFPGSEKLFSRHWWSTRLASLLEPIAVKKVVLITGVAEGYYQGVKERNPHLLQRAVFGAMPYGGEEKDHALVKNGSMESCLFEKKKGIIQFVYAGAMLPKAYAPLEKIFKSIQRYPAIFRHTAFHFIGTGKGANDPLAFNIKPLAEKYQLWNTLVYEYPQRIPYLDVLKHLNHADGIFILGSTEPHYTPSKIYQGILSKKPLLAVLHSKSSAVPVLEKSGGGMVLGFAGEEDLDKIEQLFPAVVAQYLDWVATFNPDNVNQTVFEEYTACSVTGQLAALLNRAIQ